MSAITLNFTMEEWQKLVSAGLSEEIFRCLAMRQPVHRQMPVHSIVAVVDSDTEEYAAPEPISLEVETSKLERGAFATKKTAEFAATHEITSHMILSPSGKNGKITMEDVKKALPPKKRGRKPKAKPEGDLIDGLVAKPKKAKKVKDPNAPKRALSSFFVYKGEQFPLVKAANLEVKGAAAIVALVGVNWRSLSTEDKAPYEAAAVADKERYATEKAAYDLTKGVGELVETDLEQAQEIAEVTAPKSPKSPKAPKAKAGKAKADAKAAKVAKAKADAKAAKVAKAKAAKAAKVAKAKADAKAALQKQLAELEASQEASQVDDYDGVVFDDLEGESDSEGEMDEEMVQFEFPANSGVFYYRTDDDMVFGDDDGSPSIGQWDSEDKVVIFDE